MIKHLGFIKNETQIAEFLNIADLFLSMTREDNLPNTIMESLACGTPVISTNVGGISDMVTENYNGRLIERDNAKQMAEAILHSIEDEKLLPRWSANARSSAEVKFYHKKQAESYLKVFRNLLKSDFNTKEKHKYTNKVGNKSTTSSKRISASATFPSPNYYEKAFDWFHKK